MNAVNDLKRSVEINDGLDYLDGPVKAPRWRNLWFRADGHSEFQTIGQVVLDFQTEEQAKNGSVLMTCAKIGHLWSDGLFPISATSHFISMPILHD